MMHIRLLLQVNYPTPTPFPTPSNGLRLPEVQADAWAAAEIGLQWWQMFPSSVSFGIQIGILALILIPMGAGIYWLVKKDFIGRNR